MEDYGDVAPGQKLELLCQGCFKVWFPWDPEEHWEANVPTCHSRRCRERHRRIKNTSEVYVRCPRPDKVLYTRQADAHRASVDLAVRYRQPFSVYSCPCGGLHIGRIPYRRRRNA